MHTAKAIAISGRAGAGKDTAAKMVQTRLQADGNSTLITHYADLLKYICSTFFGWDGEKNEYGRTLLQCVGTDVVRAQNPNYWVDFIADILTFFRNEWDYVIIPDARFPNEIERLKERGIHTVHLKIERPGLVSALTEKQQRHISETALDNTYYDYLILNDGDLDKLEMKLTKWVTEDLYAKK